MTAGYMFMTVVLSLFLYPPAVHSMIHRLKVSFPEGKQKVLMKQLQHFEAYFKMDKEGLLHVYRICGYFGVT